MEYEESDILETLLKNRGLIGKKDIEVFINPKWEEQTHDPFLMKDMDKAVSRIKKAVDKKEKIVLYTDYDCDGIPGGVILHDFFKKINHENFVNYIPHRHNEGYGVHTKAIDGFIKQGVTLMITADLGITNIEEVKYAQENGIDVILTDHHLPVKDKEGKQIIPSAYAVINTKRTDCNYPEKMLCGAATAWKLVNAFLVKHGSDYKIPVGHEKWWLDMVGISTIADMVPLLGENRVLAIYGLQVLRKSKRLGLLKILKNAKVEQLNLSETDVSFSIAPRLNAAGRMDDPVIAFRALLNNEESVTYADKLETLNKERKLETSSAHTQISFENFAKDQVILVGNTNWSPGILGLIASKIVDTTSKTVFVWGAGEEKGVLKGSVRAGSDGANVVQLMSECSGVLSHFGGHEEAGGFSLVAEKLEEFDKMLKEVYKRQSSDYIKKDKTIKHELSLRPEHVNLKVYKTISRLSPFGMSNPSPVIQLTGKCNNIRYFGDKKQHVELNIEGVSCVTFNPSGELLKRIQNQAQKNEDSAWLGIIEKDTYKKSIRLKLL